MKKTMFVVSFFMFLFFFLTISDCKAGAINYNSTCIDEVVAENGNYRACGQENIYLIDKKEYSSSFVSTLDLYSDEQILYAGKVDGIETFYANKFHFFGIVYDDRGFSTAKINYWSDIFADGVLVYDGSFEDTFVLDQSDVRREMLFDVTGTYIIRQHIGNEIVNVVKVIIPSKKDYGFDIGEVKYGDKDIKSMDLLEKKDDLNFKIVGGKYGFDGFVDISVNECSFFVKFKKNLTVNNDKFSKCLEYNVNNKLSITLYNGFNIGKTFKYNFKLNSNKITIQFEDSVSEVETSSRRVLIRAYSGIGKTLNDDFSLYYWSKKSDDKLTQEEFLVNYEKSKYKGEYTSNKGVILRDAVGTYYLYAMAKDEDSVAVVRSEEYVLKKKDKLNEIVINDVYFVTGLVILAILPIVLYLFIRGKDTD